MPDRREKALTDAAVAVTGDYNPHFAGPAEMAVMETRLFLARWDALQAFNGDTASFALQKYREKYDRNIPDELRYPLKINVIDSEGRHVPVPMILWCPKCGVQHIDAAEPHKPDCSTHVETAVCDCDRWTNPPHKSHLCHNCKHVWRPADVPTDGVREIETKGEHDSNPPIRRVMLDLSPRETRYKSGEIVFRREECIFKYCPTVGLCKESCRHPVIVDSPAKAGK